MICIVNDTIEELLVLDMEFKPESLWWRSMCKDEDVKTLRVGSRGRAGDSKIVP